MNKNELDKNRLSATEILERPYSRLLSRQPNGEWVAEIREIPGCHSVGGTQAEALVALEDHALELVASYLRKGQPIPPHFPNEFSGNFALRMPKGIHHRAAQMASWEGTSLNQFIVSALAERIGYAERPIWAPGSAFTWIVGGLIQTEGRGIRDITVLSSAQGGDLSGRISAEVKFTNAEVRNG